MRPSPHRGAIRAIGAAVLAATASACATIPVDALRLSPDTLEKRQLQTRRFDGGTETDLLAASAGVLQDLGFTIEESASTLGLISASKTRSAVETEQVVGAVLLAFLGVSPTWDTDQKIRVCLVSWTSRENPSVHFVRVTIQRLVWNQKGMITKAEAIESPEIYQEFFSKLSESVFLEAQKI
jgi:hypothetical protein